MNAVIETRYPPLRPGVEPQTFAREEDRARLGAVALKAYRSLARKWGLTNAEAAKLIGISESSWDRVKTGKDLALNQDQMTRISVLVGIFKGLNLLFADKMADEWVRLPNRGPLFDRRTPIDAMIENGIPFMLDVRRLIDAVRGGI